MVAPMKAAIAETHFERARAALDFTRRQIGGNQALRDALAGVGLVITRQAVSQWRIVPAEHAEAVEAATGIKRHVLRPDLWEAPARRA